jgi:hypothetical protein
MRSKGMVHRCNRIDMCWPKSGCATHACAFQMLNGIEPPAS